MAVESLLNKPFDPEQAAVEIATEIDAQGLYVPYDQLRSTVYSITGTARIQSFLHIIVPRATRDQLLPIAVPKETATPLQQLPETTLTPPGPTLIGKNPR